MLVSDFINGFKYFFRGLRTIFTPGLKRFALVPVLINSIVYSGAIFFGVNRFEALLRRFLPSGEGVLVEVARVLLWIFFALSVLVIIFFTFNLLANLFSAPFNGLLADKVERYAGGTTRVEAGAGRPFVSTIIPSIISEGKKLAIFIALSLLLLLLSLVPLVNLFLPLLWVYSTSWMLAVEYISYPVENHGGYIGDVRSYIKERRAVATGFGAAVTTFSIVPLANFLVMPAAVAGATILYMEQKGERIDDLDKPMRIYGDKE